MLYLMRKKGESIIINGDIEVQVVEVKGKSVKLGFEFPQSSTVLRKEIHDRIIEENVAASAGLHDVDITDAISGMDLPMKSSSPKMPSDKVRTPAKPSEEE
jgi:carbon storage regulator